ncbi:unnamed protein product [Diabrotica balteata]|uniref:Ionotropic glutamate receptor C-terminal domain-containing protein n=1 Tax=Diabrotica balteata TaxID=107213 RepID=A0A9N9SNQ8_DIABA|nr:unnamed protein product [Diabrotica balteata]
MESQRPPVFTSSNQEGVEAVIKGKGSYAFLMESTSIEYVIERNCELTQVGGMLDSKGYGIATPPNSPFRTPISGAILKLQEEGKLHILKTRWWKEKRGGGKCRSSLCKEMATEFRHVVCCRNDSKSTKKKRPCSPAILDDGLYHPSGSYTSYGFVSKDILN